jgi:hypothetical protein
MKKQNLNCGSCLFLNRDRIFERKCIELGKLPSAKACTSYSPDAFMLAGNEKAVDRLKMVSSAIHGMSLTEIQALAAVLHAEKSTRKAGWKFYQRVVVRYTGSASSNYFSNFAIGYVVFADKDNIKIVGDSGKMMITAMNVPDSNTIYTMEQFKVLSAEMVRKKQFSDNTSSHHYTGPHVAGLDDAIGAGEPTNRKLKVSKTRTEDLVSIIAKMSQGISPKKSRSGSDRRSGDRRLTSNSDGEIVMDWRS